MIAKNTRAATAANGWVAADGGLILDQYTAARVMAEIAAPAVFVAGTAADLAADIGCDGPEDHDPSA
ncbi:hypothetical protein ACOI1H_13435 [Loktanella sp. DJP18]|uniref:hypothetical protein n=1 Tax=Loktanella sp. DJP18 TaxID=3409788 RepID=UPI003BB59E2D